MTTQTNATQDRLHLLGIRHHGPGSAALLRQSLDALDAACVLIEGPSEGDSLIPYVAEAGMRPPVAMLLHATDSANTATFMPFAEFSPEWQAMHWSLQYNRPVRFIDMPAAVSLALKQQQEAETAAPELDTAPRPDALDLLASAAGYDDGEAFWNSLIEQHGGNHGDHALAVFASIETAMTEARVHEESFDITVTDHARDLRREAFMRTHIRAALKEYAGNIAVVCRVHTEARRRFKPGTRLVREWKGKIHEVILTNDGYEHQGKMYKSLSPIACEITGTHWSGPAFFGTTKKGSKK